MKVIRRLSLVSLLVAVAAPLARAADATPDDVVAQVTTNIDKVGTLGAKAYLIAGGLALAGVVVAFVRKAKR